MATIKLIGETVSIERQKVNKYRPKMPSEYGGSRGGGALVAACGFGKDIVVIVESYR
jgi:hypothetical protein